MKVLKALGIIILVFIVIVILLGIIAPGDFNVERKVNIKAPVEVVFEHVKYWRNWQNWSPWAEMDSTMKVTVEGKDGEKGSKYIWKGHPELTGSGEMTNTGIKDNEEITYHLHFIEPWEDQSDGYMRLINTENGSEAAWGFSGESAFPFNIMFLFMSMEDMMAPDFDRGLAKLKELSEKDNTEIQKYEVKEVEFKEKKYAAVKGKVNFKNMHEFFSASYAKLGEAIGKSRARIEGAAGAVYYTWDEQTQMSDMAAVMPVNKTVKGEGVEMIEAPDSKAFMLDHFGAYDNQMYAYKALDYYFKKNKLDFNMVLEEYITNPMAEPDTSKWHTKIYFFAK